MSALPEPAGTAIELALVLACYRWPTSPITGWCAVRLGAGRYPKVALNGTYPEGPAPVPGSLWAGAVIAVLSLAAEFVGTTPRGGLVVVPVVALAIVLWKYVTIDYDIALSVRWQRVDRLVVLAVGVAALLLPGLTLAGVILLCGRLGAWTHHSNACIRIVKITWCWSVTDGLLHDLGVIGSDVGTATAAIAMGSVYLSHYVVAAWSKARLGRHPWSWAVENRTELLVATAYAWGWARFVPARRAARVVEALRPIAFVLNAVTMVVEFAGLVAFADARLFVAAVVGAMLFNCVVALTSGLLFWENMVIGAVLIATVPRTGAPVFGFWPWLFGAAVLVMVLAGWLWRPNILGWWDTPLCAKVVWTVETADGREYGLYNNFMSPHDREYARSVGNFLVSEAIPTFPLGGVEDTAIRDCLVDAGPDEIQQAKQRYGTVYWSADHAARHADYLRRLMLGVNSGRSKSPLPRWLRWLKAPGGHLYYWGDLPRYRRRSGQVRKVTARFREDLYSSENHDWSRLRDQVLFAVDIPADGPDRVPSPRSST